MVVAAFIGAILWGSACYRTWEAERRDCLTNHRHSTVDQYEACYHEATRRLRNCLPKIEQAEEQVP